MAVIQRIIDRIFRLEIINGDGLCKPDNPYMHRWQLAGLGPWFKLYLHHFLRDDWSRDLHDHPKRFVSIGLRGRYVEETPGGSREYRAPWIRTFPATHIHRIKLFPGETAWTLVAVLRPVREWGFWHNGTWIHWAEYVQSEAAENAKDC